MAARLAPFGIAGEAAVLVLAVEDPEALEGELERLLAELGVRALVATVATARRRLLCAVLDRGERGRRARRGGSGATRGSRAERARGRSAAALPSRRCDGASTRPAARSRSARSPTAPRRPWPRPEDLGAYRLLLSLQDDDGLRQYCEDVLRPIEQRPRRQRRGAAALAGGLPRAQRQLGGGGAGAVLPSPHAALPDGADRGADRAAARPGREPDRVLARAARARAARRAGRWR